jgi:hypothetical protein
MPKAPVQTTGAFGQAGQQSALQNANPSSAASFLRIIPSLQARLRLKIDLVISDRYADLAIGDTAGRPVAIAGYSGAVRLSSIRSTTALNSAL